MKKVLFALGMTTFLVACSVPQSKELSVVDVNREVVVLPPENIIIQPDEEREILQKLPEAPQNVEAETGNYMGGLAKKLRKELRLSGVQVKEVQGQIDLIIPDKVAFGPNQIKIQNHFQESLSVIAKLLNEYEQTMVQVIGYTDNVGSVLTNQQASLKRADAIADFLRGQGVALARIITDGVGADNPVANNATTVGRELNRRVEITLISLQ